MLWRSHLLVLIVFFFIFIMLWRVYNILKDLMELNYWVSEKIKPIFPPSGCVSRVFWPISPRYKTHPYSFWFIPAIIFPVLPDLPQPDGLQIKFIFPQSKIIRKYLPKQSAFRSQECFFMIDFTFISCILYILNENNSWGVKLISRKCKKHTYPVIPAPSAVKGASRRVSR